MKRLGVLIGASLLASCAVVPTTAPAGQFETESQFSVNLPSDWSRWPSQINPATNGEYLTKDGMLLNRLHFITVADGGTIVRTFRDSEAPVFQADASEFELIELVTRSLEQVGYNSVEADDIRPAVIDGEDGLRFSVTGNWENGLNVRGDVAVVTLDDELNVILFMAPAMHYYGELQSEVDSIISSMDLAAN